jgi:hypothetical protein
MCAHSSFTVRSLWSAMRVTMKFFSPFCGWSAVHFEPNAWA